MIWNERIKELRLQNHYTLDYVATVLGVSEATAQRYESTIKNIPYEIIIKYAKMFRVSPSYIMGWEADYSSEDELLIETQHLNHNGYVRLLEYAKLLQRDEKYRK